MWVFVRTSTNFAHLTSFQAIQFMDWPVSKTLDISVCQTSQKWKQSFQNAAFCICCSSLVRGTKTQFNLIASLHVFHWERLLWHYDQHNNVGRNESSSSENPLGSLKMTNRTHTDERKMVQLSYLVPAYGAPFVKKLFTTNLWHFLLI